MHHDASKCNINGIALADKSPNSESFSTPKSSVQRSNTNFTKVWIELSIMDTTILSKAYGSSRETQHLSLKVMQEADFHLIKIKF